MCINGFITSESAATRVKELGQTKKGLLPTRHKIVKDHTQFCIINTIATRARSFELFRGGVCPTIPLAEKAWRHCQHISIDNIMSKQWRPSFCSCLLCHHQNRCCFHCLLGHLYREFGREDSIRDNGGDNPQNTLLLERKKK